MRVVPSGELAFGASVLALASGLLFLAAGRLTAPVVPAAPLRDAVSPTAAPKFAAATKQAQPAAIAPPVRVARRMQPVQVARAGVGRNARPAGVAGRTRPIRIAHRTQPVVATIPATHDRRASETPQQTQKVVHRRYSAGVRAGRSSRGDEVISRATAAPPPQSGAGERTLVELTLKPQAPAKPDRRPVSAGHASRLRRAAPALEATPEPPIGYDEQPALLKAAAPAGSATDAP